VRRQGKRLVHANTVVMLLPPLVERALALTERLGFERSCIPEVGRLLHVLAAARGRERVAEIGTGTGVGAAWIVSALPPEVPFFTAELDEGRAAAAVELFRDDPQVRVLAGDWRDTLPPEAPFDLVFFDATKQLRPRDDGELVIGLLTPGGLAVLDDLTPGRPGHDPVREVWLEDERLASTEILVTSASSVILAVRR
jgi:predicted O-methyltransferase YrrM